VNEQTSKLRLRQRSFAVTRTNNFIMPLYAKVIDAATKCTDIARVTFSVRNHGTSTIKKTSTGYGGTKPKRKPVKRNRRGACRMLTRKDG
jgi:hypothetical protein